MKELQFQINISAAQYLKYYQGTAQSVLVKDDSGTTLRFPASLLKKFVTHDGIHGRFVMQIDNNNKCIAIQRVE